MARGELGLTLGELAEKVGISERTLGNWERGDTVPTARIGKLIAFFKAEGVAVGKTGKVPRVLLAALDDAGLTKSDRDEIAALIISKMRGKSAN